MEGFGLQFFQLSKDKVRSPVISEVIQLGRGIADKTGIVSVRYGKRMVSTAFPMPLNKLTEDVFVEVVDYDPVKNSLMFIGEPQPSALLAVHLLLLRAREDVNLIVHLHKVEENTRDPLKRTKEILSSVKGEGYVFKDKEESLFFGKGFADTVERLKEEM
ncbi:MAG TPA: hypothetical protein ENI45_01570 [Thermoplasmatales archaeon]|nr:hypothetical protein [Thermoplasmatales archaeon]